MLSKLDSFLFKEKCFAGETSIDSKPETVFRFDGKIFTIHGKPLPWDKAKKFCEKNRASLAVVENVDLAVLLSSEPGNYKML